MIKSRIIIKSTSTSQCRVMTKLVLTTSIPKLAVDLSQLLSDWIIAPPSPVSKVMEAMEPSSFTPAKSCGPAFIRHSHGSEHTEPILLVSLQVRPSLFAQVTTLIFVSDPDTVFSANLRRYPPWLANAFTRDVGRLSPIWRKPACIIQVHQCSTRGRRVRTLVLPRQLEAKTRANST
jgi:hypothetical protein